MSFAKVTIVGRLGNDPETKYTQSGTLILSFSMAADGRRRGGGDNQSNTSWFRVSAFAEQAERLATMVERGYIGKGRMLYVEGQFEARPYTGNDGKERTSLDVTLTDWQFIGSGQQDGQRNQSGDLNSGQGNNQGGNFGGSQGGGRNDRNQDSGGYGGSDYGNEFPSGDEPSDLNDVPF
jgi:single-strand DNA-binding protein